MFLYIYIYIYIIYLIKCEIKSGFKSKKEKLEEKKISAKGLYSFSIAYVFRILKIYYFNIL